MICRNYFEDGNFVAKLSYEKIQIFTVINNMNESLCFVLFYVHQDSFRCLTSFRLVSIVVDGNSL